MPSFTQKKSAFDDGYIYIKHPFSSKKTISIFFPNFEASPFRGSPQNRTFHPIPADEDGFDRLEGSLGGKVKPSLLARSVAYSN